MHRNTKVWDQGSHNCCYFGLDSLQESTFQKNPGARTYPTCCHWCESRSIPIVWKRMQSTLAATHFYHIFLRSCDNWYMSGCNYIDWETKVNTCPDSEKCVCQEHRCVLLFSCLFKENCGGQKNNINYGMKFFWSWQILAGFFTFRRKRNSHFFTFVWKDLLLWVKLALVIS